MVITDTIVVCGEEGAGAIVIAPSTFNAAEDSIAQLLWARVWRHATPEHRAQFLATAGRHGVSPGEFIRVRYVVAFEALRAQIDGYSEENATNEGSH